MREDTSYVTVGTHGMSCNECGKDLEPDDEIVVCPDCGAVICRACAESGALDEHECDEEDCYE